MQQWAEQYPAPTIAQRGYFAGFDYVPVVTVASWLLMMVTGTEFGNASILAAAVAFGLLAIRSAGGIKSAPGLLNFVLIAKFLLIAIILKAFTFQPTDSHLLAPRKTCEVMAVGFFALFLGSALFRRTTKIKGVVRSVEETSLYLTLTIVFFIVCMSCALAILAFSVTNDQALTGGFWGIAHQFGSATSICIIPAMYYAWSSGSRRFLSHPLVLVILACELLYGIATTSKLLVMEPVLCYFAVGFIRYGMKSKALWAIVGVGLAFYMTIIYPYSQYVRDHGGRDGTLKERIEVIQEVFFNVSTDANFRDMVDLNIQGGDFYLGKNSLHPLSRLAMIGEADLLISATDATSTYTGWETIVNGLKLMVPSFIMPDKPISGGGNRLGHIAGQLAEDDLTTQVSFGFMANLYNAFGLTGVFFGTIIFIFVLYYGMRLWFADQTLSFGPFGSTIWYLTIGMLFQHSLVESPLGGILPSLLDLVAVVSLVVLSRFLNNSFGPNGRKYFGRL